MESPPNGYDMNQSEAPHPENGFVHPGLVLAADDDEISLSVLCEFLQMSGHTVVTAKDGREALSVFEKLRPHLVITDIRMPHVDGLEVLRQVREIDDAVAVILVTGHGELDVAVRALRRGAYDFLQKPVNADILINTVRRGLEHVRLKRFERDYTRILEERVEERTRELARTNDFLQGILDSSTAVSIVMTDFDNNVLFWNKGAENIFGHSAEEVIGSKITRFYAPDETTGRLMQQLDKMIRSRDGKVQGHVRQLAKDGRTVTVSLTFSPMLDGSGNLRGVLGLGQDVTEEVRLHEEVLSSYRRLQQVQSGSVFALAKLAGSRDGEMGNHLRRIQKYCRALCRRLRSGEKYKETLTDQFVEDLVQSSILHDIGKVGIPDSILFYPDKFGVGQYEIMKQHTIYGGKALEEAVGEADEESFLSLAKDIAYYHHERWDGKGYPLGLRGEEIPLAARIVAIADVYDALTTRRRYKKAYSHQKACSIIMETSGEQFDPELVGIFMQVQDEFRKIRQEYAGEDEQAVV